MEGDIIGFPGEERENDSLDSKCWAAGCNKMAASKFLGKLVKNRFLKAIPRNFDIPSSSLAQF
jgi:hypothetical protein